MSDNNFDTESLLRQYKTPAAPPQLKNRIFSRTNPSGDSDNRRLTQRSTTLRKLTLPVAASIVIAAGAVIFLIYAHKAGPDKAAPTKACPTPMAGSPDPQQILAQIQKQIADEAQAARLMAIAKIYPDSPAFKNRRLDIYREIVKYYPKSAVSAQAEKLLKRP